MAASVVLSYRSDTTTSCRYSLGNGTVNLAGFYIPTLTTSSSAIGGTELYFTSSTMLLQDLNMLNLTTTFSILTRIRPAQVASRGVYSLGTLRNNKIGVGMTSGHLIGHVYNDVGTTVLNALTITGGTPSQFTTTGSHMDVVTVFNFTTITGAVTTYSNGTLTSTLNISAAWKTGVAPTGRELSSLCFGHLETWALFSGGLNEIVIWNKALTATTIGAMPLVSTLGVTSTGGLVGSARTDWVDVGSRDAMLWTSITAAQIANGINQVQAGLTQTGLLTSEVWSTLAASSIKFGEIQIQNSATITGSYQWDTITANNMRNGINHIQDGVTVTGTFAGETWSTLAASYIAYGQSQIQNSVTITGALMYPVAMSGSANTVEIANIKENIRYILDINNTTTGAPVSDLSTGLSNRVKDVYKVHPEKILLGGNQMPALTVYFTSKTILSKTIAKNQVLANREAELTFSIVGLVTNQFVPNTYTSDQLDDDVEYLMENVEKVLRSYTDIGGYTRWSMPNSVTYHSSSLDERNQLRVGILDLQCKVFY